MRRLALLAFAASALLAPAGPAAARDEESVSPLRLLNYTVSGGGVVPVGTAGEGIESGPHGSAAIHYDSGSGFMLGAEVGFTRSNDNLRTRIVAFGLSARISPADFNAAYIKLGVGGYSLGYEPRSASTPSPGSLVRPGGSFGVGFELVHLPRVSFGLSGTYHRIAIATHDARAFVALTLDVIYRPYEF